MVVSEHFSIVFLFDCFSESTTLWPGKSCKIFLDLESPTSYSAIFFFFFVGYHEILFELIFWNRIGAAENLGAHPENRSNLILDSILSRIISTYFIDIYTQIFYKPIPVSQIWHSPHLPPSLLIGYLVIPPQCGDSPRLRCNIWGALAGVKTLFMFIIIL